MRRTPQIDTLFGPSLGERDLLAIAIALGAEDVSGWDATERALVKGLQRQPASMVRNFREQVRSGGDPLGDILCKLRPREVRRLQGATYTPTNIIKSMANSCKALPAPGRIVDPGCGSGRYLMEFGARHTRSQLVGVEIDPVAAILARGNLAACGWSSRSQVQLVDFRQMTLATSDKPTLFVGNPPYVRHHLIGQRWKKWLTRSAETLGVPASQLCGLHLHFFLATTLMGSAGDYGAYITAAEWLDVNYGELLRRLAVRQLGVQSITVIEPTAEPFPDTATTAAITTFVIQSKPKTISFRRVANAASLKKLPEPKSVPIERLESEPRWTVFTRSATRIPSGYVELGDLCRVHRGAVTGANGIWVVSGDVNLPKHVLYPTVTRARELFAAKEILDDSSQLRRVVDLPIDLDDLKASDRRLVDAFLKKAKKLGADRGYVAENRRAWWSVGLRAPAPILCSYMARRAPAFVENGIEARHINIAHGIYPRESMTKRLLRRLVAFLATKVSVNLGRTYAGGLTKFEPGEIERIPVPSPELLLQMT